MDPFLILAILIVVVAVFLIKRTITPNKEDNWPYYAKNAMSQPEQILYFRLIQALPEHITLAQVGLSRLLGIKKGNNTMEWFRNLRSH
jgi:hypothetical protein